MRAALIGGVVLSLLGAFIVIKGASYTSEESVFKFGHRGEDAAGAPHTAMDRRARVGRRISDHGYRIQTAIPIPQIDRGVVGFALLVRDVDSG
jgi:hypothetical protein